MWRLSELPASLEGPGASHEVRQQLRLWWLNLLEVLPGCGLTPSRITAVPASPAFCVHPLTPAFELSRVSTWFLCSAQISSDSAVLRASHL